MAELASRSVLHTWLHAQSTGARQVWAVVDGSAELSQATRRALDRCGPSINLLSHRTRDEAALAVAPRLIGVSATHLPTVVERLWLEQPADEPAVFFVAAGQDDSDLEAALRPCVSAELPDGEVMLFRWWDARIWWAIQQLRPDAHPDVVRLTSLFAASLALARDGVPHQGNHPSQEQSNPFDSDLLQLTQPTYNRLLELGEADAVLGLCRAEYPDALHMVTPEQRHALACQQIDWAVDVGFSAPHDHALAVRIAAELGTDWPQQPEWLEVITKARTEGRTLLAAIEAM